jgi:maltose O-acetyltransferase
MVKKKIISEKEKMLGGQMYTPLDRELTAERNKSATLLHEFNVKEYLFTQRSRQILSELIPNSPADLVILAPFHCDYGYNIHCGRRVFFNVNCVVLDVVKITIGNNVLIGPGVHLYGATHPVDHVLRRTRMYGREITIGDDCWSGGGAIICPGVNIGKGCVIAAGSIVTSDVPEFCMVAGNPAKVKKDLGAAVPGTEI